MYISNCGIFGCTFCDFYWKGECLDERYRRRSHILYTEAAVHGALCCLLLEGRIILNVRNLKFWTTSKGRILSEITSDILVELRDWIIKDFFLKGWQLNCRFWREPRWKMGSGNVYDWNYGLWYCIKVTQKHVYIPCQLSWLFCLSCHAEHFLYDWKMNAILTMGIVKSLTIPVS